MRAGSKQQCKMWVRDHEMYEETARKIRRGAVQRTEKERHTAGKKK